MRVKNSLLNILAGLANQMVITGLSFISRTVFISSLGIEYLGVNGLFTNILAMLTLAEAGLGASIMYSLYKPVAENDYHRISILMKFYKKTYMVIAFVILTLGLSILPFLDIIIKDTKIDNINYIYLIFLLNTVAPYFYVHKSSFLNVCQKGYIVTGIYSISSIISVTLKILILYYTTNYLLYLIIDSIITISNSVILAYITNKLFPFLKKKINSTLDLESKKDITKNVKAIVIQNIGNYLVFGTDNIIISSFVSIAAVGLYSNYIMLIEICKTFINQISNNVYHSVGNLVAKENINKVFNVFNALNFLNFWMYSILAIFLTIMLEPFIILWIGKKFVIEESYLLYILMFMFYEKGMRNAISTLKTTSGIFHEDRFAPLGQACINLVFSIVLVQKLGITGVILGTLVSTLIVPFWLTPYLVYKKVFIKPVTQYFKNYIYYLGVGILIYFITRYITNFVPIDDIYSLIIKGILCFVIPNLIYILIYHKTSEFKYLTGIFRVLLNSVYQKIKPKKFRSVG